MTENKKQSNINAKESLRVRICENKQKIGLFKLNNNKFNNATIRNLEKDNFRLQRLLNEIKNQN